MPDSFDLKLGFSVESGGDPAWEDPFPLPSPTSGMKGKLLWKRVPRGIYWCIFMILKAKGWVLRHLKWILTSLTLFGQLAIAIEGKIEYKWLYFSETANQTPQWIPKETRATHCPAYKVICDWECLSENYDIWWDINKKSVSAVASGKQETEGNQQLLAVFVPLMDSSEVVFSRCCVRMSCVAVWLSVSVYASSEPQHLVLAPHSSLTSLFPPRTLLELHFPKSIHT